MEDRALVINKFGAGVNSDISPETVDNNTMTAGRNISITTNDSNQMVLQKADGTKEVIDGYPNDLVPLAVQEYNDIAYFVNHNKTEDKTEYGMFPSVDINGTLYEEVPGSSDYPPTVTTSLLDVHFGTTTTPPTYTLPKSPYDYEEIVITNNSDFWVGTKIESTIQIRNHETSVLDYKETNLISPNSYIILRVSGTAYSTITTGGVLSLIISSIKNTETESEISSDSFVIQQTEIASNCDASNVLFMTAGNWNLTDIETGPTMKYKDSSMAVYGLWYGESVSGQQTKIVLSDINGKTIFYSVMPAGQTSNTVFVPNSSGGVDTFSYSVNVNLISNTVQWIITQAPKSVMFAYIDIDYQNPSTTVSGYESAIDLLNIYVGLPFSRQLSVSTSSRTFVHVKFDTLHPEFYLKYGQLLKLGITSWGNSTTSTIKTPSQIAAFKHNPITIGDYVMLQPVIGVYGMAEFDILLVSDGTSKLEVNYVGTEQKKAALPVVNKYSPLLNYNSTSTPISSDAYIEPFRTDVFGYTADSIVDIELQPSYDGTVNIITTSEGTPPRIVNSRTTINGNSGQLVKRDGGNLENVYSDDSIEKTRLIPYLGDVVADLTFLGVQSGGVLPAAGYKYYFKLLTSDGAESEIVEQSRLVSVHFGDSAANSRSSIDLKNTNKLVKFKLSNLTNKAFRFVQVYFSQTVGETDTAVSKIGKISSPFEIINEECIITHTGYEATEEVALADLILEYTAINSASTVNQKNGRLLLGNTTATNMDINILKNEALKCYPTTSTAKALDIKSGFEVIPFSEEEVTYANPDYVYNNLGYIPGETYEFGINYVFDRGNISDTFPIMGRDFNNTAGLALPLGQDIGWRLEDGVNSKGVVRSQYISVETALSYVNKDGSVRNFTFRIDTSGQDFEALKAIGVVGFFISRRRRMPDMQIEGLIVQATSIPLRTATTKETALYGYGNYSGIGFTGKNAKLGYSLIPAPMGAIPYTIEGIKTSGSAYDTIHFAGVAESTLNTRFALYSPDIQCDGARASTIFDNTSDYSINLTHSSIINPDHGGSKTRHAIESYKRLGGYKYYYERILRASYVISSADILSTTISYNLYGPALKYVPDGFRSLTGNTFTSRSDRQALLAIYKQMDSGGVYTTIGQANKFTSLYTAADTADKSPDKYSLVYDEVKSSITSDDVFLKATLLSNVIYSPYVGITLNTTSALSTLLDIELSSTVANGKFRAAMFDTGDFPGYIEDSNIGVICSIYNNQYGDILPLSAWIDRYKIDRNDSYFAVSKRFSVSNPPSESQPMTGGDCYLGFNYQQIWRPGGVDGVPTATDPTAYTDDRSGTGLVNTGYAIIYPVRSSYNFLIRAGVDGTDSEYNLYKSQRTTLNESNVKSLRSIKRAETDQIDYGNFQEQSILSKTKYENSTPFTKITQPNRVYVSNVASANEFENGYRNFKGFNFRDYDESNGPITAIVSQGLYTYIVYRGGVSVIEVLERSALQSESGNNVYIGNATVLPEKATNVLSFTGSKYQKSVVASEYGIFGVDSDRKKIWRVIGNKPEIISDGRVQSIINPWFDDYLTNIFTSYNQNTGEISFTFVSINENGGNPIKTLRTIIFNGRLNVWYGESDDNKQYQFLINQTNYSTKEISDVFRLFTDHSMLKNVTEYIDSGYVKDVHQSYFEFIISNENKLKSILNNIVLNGTGIPSSIDIHPESSSNFSIEKLGLSNTNDEPCSTNVFILDSSLLSIVDSFNIKRTASTTDIDYKSGDLITINLNGVLTKFIVADTTDSGGDLIITLNREMTLIGGDTVSALYYGWKVPIRLKLMENDNGQTRISIPPKLVADKLAGNTVNKEKAIKNKDSSKPSGRWFRVRMNFDGIDPVYINSIISSIGLIYS